MKERHQKRNNKTLYQIKKKPTEYKIGNLKKIDQASQMKNKLKMICNLCKKVSVKTYRH